MTWLPLYVFLKRGYGSRRRRLSRLIDLLVPSPGVFTSSPTRWNGDSMSYHRQNGFLVAFRDVILELDLK